MLLGPMVFLAGAVVLAVGLGLGPSHAVEEGLGPGAVVGFVLVAVGLLAVGWGGWKVLRSTRRRWWVLTGPLLLLTAYLSVAVVGTAVLATFTARPDLGERTPADVGLEATRVTFTTVDDVRLAGWYVPSTTGAAVVLLHGAGSTRSAVLDHAAVLARHGLGVLLFDARGHGESGGRGMDFGWWGERDTDAAVTFLAGRPDVDAGRIAAVGLSMGGEEAIGAFGTDPRIRAVVAEGATNRVYADKGWLDHYGLRGDVQRGLEWLTYSLVEVLTPAPEPASLRASVAAAAPRPALLVTAGAVPDERLAAELVQEGAPGSVEIWTVPGAGHIGGLRSAPEEWEARVVAFLDASLDVGLR